jgi:hypothetical protein
MATMGRAIRPSVWTVLDILMVASVVILVGSVVMRRDVAHPVVSAMRDVAERVQWRETYETGLALGLLLAGLAAIAIASGLYLVTRARRHPS